MQDNVGISLLDKKKKGIDHKQHLLYATECSALLAC